MPQKPYLEAGQIVGTHGVRGEVRVQPWCDSPQQFATFKKLYWDKDGKQAVKVKGRPHKNIALALLEGVDKEIPIEQAKQTVYDALAPLGEEYRAILKQGFENRWIDVYQNEGKRSGAYSAGASYSRNGIYHKYLHLPN